MKRNKGKKKSFNELLESIGATLLRHNKHLIYKLPNGKHMAVSHSSSDNYVEQVNIRLLEKLMGVKF